ncbi:MAG: DUF6615 family protein [Janthinobacterium lividum]
MNLITEKFEEITKRIWNDISFADYYRILYGEESITDSILLDLAKQNWFSIRILQTPKHLEPKLGTDWEWYVGSNNYGWIRYAIQAKKLKTRYNNRYTNLKHFVGPHPDNYQTKKLRIFANDNYAVPLYNFYNYFPDATEADHWQCSKPFDKELLGWTFTTLKNVETAIVTKGSRTFNKIHRLKDTLPIRCLFTCPYFQSLYQDRKTIDSAGEFLGEPFRKIATLPRQFINARETGILKEFPEELYSTRLYPKRIAIIELTDETWQTLL